MGKLNKIFGYFFKKNTEIEETGLMTLTLGNKATILHYMREGQKLVALTLSTTDKVKRIQAGTDAQVAFTKGTKQLFDVKDVTVVEDQTRVQAVFDKMLANKFTHFSKRRDNLVVIEMVLK